MFQLLVDCAMAKNLKISLSSLDFWDEFKTTIVTVLEDQLAQQEWEYLFKPYVEIFKVLIMQSQRSKVAPGHEADIEDVEAVGRGLSVAKYRENACDVYLRAYLLLKRVHREQGQTLIFQIIQ